MQARGQLTIAQLWSGALEAWDAKPEGMGGWDLDIHHNLDFSGQRLRLGDGSNITATSVPAVLKTMAGNGTSARETDGVSATSSSVISPEAAVAGPDGSIYIAEAQHCIRRVTPDGTIHAFAGTCQTSGFGGDNGPATSALLNGPTDLAVGPDGSIYIADANNQRVRRVFPNGTIQTVAGSGPTGNGSGGFWGDGGPAVQAVFNQPWGVDVAADGTLYIADHDNERIRRVGPDGIVTTVAGNGMANCSCGTGGLATAATLDSPRKVRIGADGTLYIVEFSTNIIRTVGNDGVIRLFAGNGGFGFGGDGGPATSATLRAPEDAALGPDGSVYIVDQNSVVRRVLPSGIINTVAGTVGGGIFSGENEPATLAKFGNSQGVRVGPDGSLYIADSADNRVLHVLPTLSGFPTAPNQFNFPSSDGRQVYVFDGNGRHLQTLDAFTGATLLQFAYDSAGRLSGVTDVAGNVTQIKHDSNGNLSSIVAPFGEQMTFTPDVNGYLATGTDAAGQETQFTYDPKGLMLSKTNPRNMLSQYSYDTAGRLTEDQDPAGGSKTLSRTESAGGFSVTSTTALNRTSVYQTTTPQAGAFGRTNTLPDGLQSSLQFTSNGTTTVTVPDGTTTITTETPDPRPGFGMLSPVSSVTTKTPSGLTSVQTTSRTATFSGANLATFTEQTNLNGNVWSRAFNASALTWTTVSPVGRQSVTNIDSAGRTTQIAVPGTTPFAFTYDAHGRLATTTQGMNTWTQGYDTQGYLASVTDPLAHAISYVNDAVGRPRQTQLADSRRVVTTYDGNSNTTGITLPSTEQHLFSFTPVDLTASYTPPSVPGGGVATTYGYDVDRHLKTMTRPDGVSVTYGYDSAGRLHTTTYPQGTVTLGYSATTGQLVSSSAPSGESLAYTYDGFLRTGVSWSGPVSGALTLGFDNNFRMTSQTLNGTPLSFGYDLDGLLTGAGALTLTLDPTNGRLNGTILGSMTDTYTYDTNGLFATYVAKYNGNALYSEIVGRDATGRVTQKTETVQGTTHVWVYTFDPTGRLTDVTEDGNFYSHYGYDADDNRTTYTNTGGTVNPTYDAQDRLQTYGSTTYGYTANGELATRTAGGQTTNYTYDALGNLLHLGPPTGAAIDYLVDGENRRVGKKIGGTLTTGYLYQDALNVVAQLDASGSLVARYVFGSKANVPDYYTTSAGTFRILSDHLGSPRLVVNTSTGAVVEEIDYDEFGVVTKDTAPGTIPFGFAGGLYDKDTGLVRFGARDYDASVGRWTAKDPIRFDGRSLNLYAYAFNDPINTTDPNGKKALCDALFKAVYEACKAFGAPPLDCGVIAEHVRDACENWPPNPNPPNCDPGSQCCQPSAPAPAPGCSPQTPPPPPTCP